MLKLIGCPPHETLMRPLSFASTLLVVVLAAASAHGTSYVPIEDGALYDQAAAIAQVNVISVGPAPARGVPAIDYIVVVERLLKGHIAGSTVVVLEFKGGLTSPSLAAIDQVNGMHETWRSITSERMRASRAEASVLLCRSLCSRGENASMSTSMTQS